MKGSRMAHDSIYRSRVRLWIYQGDAAWHFLTLPKAQGAKIKALHAHGPRRGFGALRVTATIGGTRWKTSIFPDSKTGSYVLPVKASVRKKERLSAGDTVSLLLNLSG